MPENYKNYILIGIAFLVGVFFSIFIIKPSLENREATQSSGQPSNTPPVQLADTNFMEVTPVEKLGVDISDPQALARLGDQYFESNNFNQAIELYKKTLEIDPNDIDTINDLGLAYHYTGNSDLAEETLIKGAESAPGFQRIWLSLGYILMSIGKNEEATAILQKTVEMAPDNEIGQEAMRLLSQL
jgi:tetratricopeptide (TPR) repeat protein